jgi:C1A family cysteine protease
MKTQMIRRILAFGICATVLFAACSKDGKTPDEPDPDPDPDPQTTQRAMGWNRESEDMSKYPREISFGFGSAGSSSLPSKVDLSDKLPPVGNQGSYGTCVVWSIGYGLHSYLNAVSRGLSKQDLTNTANQFSPADLWMAMPAGEYSKGNGCNNAYFDPAFGVLVTRGVASMSVAPYSSLNCDGSPQQSWTNDAANHKIKNYRLIADADMTAENLKSQLSQGRAISIGAKLGDNFLAWQNDGVLNSDTYLGPNMQHANHAMLLAGYDDSKGANGAFLVYNSWGDDWGNRGYIWVDYSFFLVKFVFAALVATPESNITPNDDYEIDTDDLVSGADLAAFHAYDMPNYDMYGNRQVFFNIYNAGTAPIRSSSRWSVVYMFYNAFNANDYGILTHFYYTDEVTGAVEFNQVGWQTPVGGVGICINQDIPPGKNIAAMYFNQPHYEYFSIKYNLPRLNGYYYMVVMADAFNSIAENDKQNNNFFIADERGYPYFFMNGMPTYAGMQTKSAGEGRIAGSETKPDSPVYTPVTPENPNMYSPEEIQNMIIKLRESGELERITRSFDEKRKTEVGGK